MSRISEILQMTDDELTDYLTDAHRGEVNTRFRELVKFSKEMIDAKDYFAQKGIEYYSSLNKIAELMREFGYDF